MTCGVRLFFAIGLWGLLDLSHLRRGLDEVQELRWVSPDKVHITLNFLGEVDRTACDDAKARLAEVASEQAPFTLQWGHAGSFPEGRPPHVLWVGVNPVSADRVGRISRDLGNDRPTPHVTVARVKGLVGREVVGKWKAVRCSWPDVRVTQIQLVESKLTPAGPIYSVISSERLRGE